MRQCEDTPPYSTWLPSNPRREKPSDRGGEVGWRPFPSWLPHLPGLLGPGSGTFLEAGVGDPWILGTG